MVSDEFELPKAGSRPLLPLLVEESRRQLDICNACRYCEGMCAVYPALERRTVLSMGDISQLANLCHDCRACFDACMYAAPHEFDINVPQILAAVRLADYERYTWPAKPPALLRGWLGIFAGTVIASLLVLLIAVGYHGGAGLTHDDGGANSPYDLIPEWLLLVLLIIPAVYAVAIMALAGRAFWRSTAASSPTGASRPPGTAVRRAVWDVLTLRYLRGGGGDCYYPEKTRPSAGRRRLHMAVMYGFGLCLVSTIAAAILQHLMSSEPPYPFLSVPVITGLLGGIGLVVGCTGLLYLKAHAARGLGVAQMTVKDYGLLSALTFLALTGLATYLTRSTPAFGVVFLIHLATVMVSFAAAPYSKFSHMTYRFLALVRDHLEA
jgi:citrate/tricarballylate utilization protein